MEVAAAFVCYTEGIGIRQRVVGVSLGVLGLHIVYLVFILVLPSLSPHTALNNPEALLLHLICLQLVK